MSYIRISALKRHKINKRIKELNCAFKKKKKNLMCNNAIEKNTNDETRNVCD